MSIPLAVGGVAVDDCPSARYNRGKDASLLLTASRCSWSGGNGRGCFSDKEDDANAPEGAGDTNVGGATCCVPGADEGCAASAVSFTNGTEDSDWAGNSGESCTN